MTSTGKSYLQLHQAGEHVQGRGELLALGAGVRDEPVYADALAVARETMRCVRHNIKLSIPRLRELDYGWAIRRAVMSAEEAMHREREEPILDPPPFNIEQLLGELERQAKGVLPMALRAFYEVVGAVNFVGAHPAWGEQQLDPLVVISARYALDLDDWMKWSTDREGDGTCRLPIAPDEWLKYL